MKLQDELREALKETLLTQPEIEVVYFNEEDYAWGFSPRPGFNLAAKRDSILSDNEDFETFEASAVTIVKVDVELTDEQLISLAAERGLTLDATPAELTDDEIKTLAAERGLLLEKSGEEPVPLSDEQIIELAKSRGLKVK